MKLLPSFSVLFQLHFIARTKDTVIVAFRVVGSVRVGIFGNLTGISICSWFNMVIDSMVLCNVCLTVDSCLERVTTSAWALPLEIMLQTNIIIKHWSTGELILKITMLKCNTTSNTEFIHSFRCGCKMHFWPKIHMHSYYYNYFDLNYFFFYIAITKTSIFSITTVIKVCFMLLYVKWVCFCIHASFVHADMCTVV